MEAAILGIGKRTTKKVLASTSIQMGRYLKGILLMEIVKGKEN